MPLVTIRIERVRRDHTPRRPRRRARIAAFTAGTAAVAALGTTVAIDAATASNVPPNTTNVAFVALPSPHKLFANKVIKANTPTSIAGIGGSTTVPTNATTIQLQVSASDTGAGSGTLSIFPAGNPAGVAANGKLFWESNESNSGLLATNIGLKDQITFESDTDTKATASIVGYSTQVTDGDINGSDGIAGQVLTDTGAGAAWQALPAVTAGTISPTGGHTGDILTNTGGGVAWQAPHFQSAYTNTVVIHPNGTDIQNGNALLAAVTGGGGQTIQLEGGNYDLGSQNLPVGNGLSIVGAGPPRSPRSARLARSRPRSAARCPSPTSRSV